MSRIKLGEGSAPPPVEHKDRGKVPAYLKKRQEEAEEAKRQAARPPSPKAPPGFRKVDAAEKDSTLAILRTRKAEVEKAMRALPFNIETVGQKQREKDLQDRMAHLDKLLGMFSRPTVFIPADAEPIATSVPPLESLDGGAKAAPPAGPQAAGVRRPRSREGAAGNRSDSIGVRHGSAAPWEEQEPPASKATPRQRRTGGDPTLHMQPHVLPGAGMLDEPQQPVRGVRTTVQVAAPPGGKSSLQFY